jgi:hypothetical protein
MKAILVIQTANGYAFAPYSGTVPENFVENMSVAAKLKSYSYSDDAVIGGLEQFFEPEPVAAGAA